MTPSDQSNKALLQFNGRNCFERYHERFPKTLGMKKLKCYLANISSKIRKRTLNFMPASSKFFLKNSRRILQAFCFRCFCLLGACKKHFSCHLGYKNVKMKKKFASEPSILRQHRERQEWSRPKNVFQKNPFWIVYQTKKTTKIPNTQN